MQKRDFNIVFISSHICGGKSFIGEMLGIELGYLTIEVSSIVKDIMGAKDRDKIISTSITDEIVSKIRTLLNHTYAFTEERGVFIIGARELGIFDKISTLCKENLYVTKDPNEINGPSETTCISRNINSMWIEVPSLVREDRFYLRNRPEDREMTFEEANESDETLGIEELRDRFIRPICITPQHFFISQKLNNSSHISANIHHSIQLEISEFLFKKEDS